MKGVEQKTFKAESSTVPSIRCLEFPVSLEITDKDAVGAFQRVEAVYNNLVKAVAKLDSVGITASVTEPSCSTPRMKKFEIASELGLKVRMKVSLDLNVVANFDGEHDFWSKGRAISKVIDVLEEFGDIQGREKGCVVFVERSKFPDEQKEPSEPIAQSSE